MMLTRSRARSIGWALILAVCFALTIALTFKVNAVKSQVRLAERRIAALKQEKNLLETEFETRANQQQLTALNDVEFGYQAPTAGQYLESERDLAVLGKPRGPGAPDMIRVASAEAPPEPSAFPAMVNPLTGRALAAEAPRPAADGPGLRKAELTTGRGPDRIARITPVAASDGLVQRLSHVDKPGKSLKTAGKSTRVALEE